MPRRETSVEYELTIYLEKFESRKRISLEGGRKRRGTEEFS